MRNTSKILRLPDSVDLLKIKSEWLAIGLSTEEANRREAEDGADEAYAIVGLKRPAIKIWLSSPLEGAMAASILAEADQVGNQVGNQVRNQVRDQVGNQVRDQVRDQVWNQVGAAIYGQHDSGWLSYLDTFRFLPCVGRLSGLARVAKSCGWWWPFEGAVIFTDRPSGIHRDEQNRLHSETGPAISYRDGFAVYAWHGTRVPIHWIENRQNLDPNEVIKSTNVEQRAAGAAICGWPKMLSVLKSNVIDDSGNDDIGQLIELNLPGLQEPGLFLKAKCPRNGIIVEGVPRVSDIDGLPIKTALAAQAWRIGDPLSEYIHPETRT